MASQQSIAALERANTVRFAARDIKYAVRDGDMSIREALNHPDAGVIPLNKLLEAQPRWGPTRTHKLISRRLGMSVSVQFTQIRELTPRQRDAIAKGFEDPDYWVLEAGLRSEAL